MKHLLKLKELLLSATIQSYQNLLQNKRINESQEDTSKFEKEIMVIMKKNNCWP